MKHLKLFYFIFLLSPFAILYAQTATITGVLLNNKNTPIADVTISTSTSSAISNNNGYYLLEVIADTENTIAFSHIGYKNVVLKELILATNEIYEFNPVMNTNTIQIDGVTVAANGQKKVEGITSISPQIVRRIPGANAGVENILKLLPGVSSSNELSTQFSVRGGNFDENLVYINEIEVYRPFLIRSGQQEGLSFVNSSMVQNIYFSSGGFQAKYGDKLSSVLDITYKKPLAFGLQANIDFLGANATLETSSKNKKFTSITGARYRNNSLLVNSTQVESNFNPTFIDIQSYLTYQFSPKTHLNFLGNISVNDYKNEPLTRETNFGTLNEPKKLFVFYEGQENSKFNTTFGALKATHFLNENTTLKLISSMYHTTEEEYSDVIAQYQLKKNNDIDTDNITNITPSLRGYGTQFTRSRNDLDALIFNLEHKGKYTKNNNAIAWGIKYTREDIRDQIRESKFISSAGFFIRPPLNEFTNNEPKESFTAPIVAYQGINARNFVKTDRFSGFLQYSKQTEWNNNAIYYNLGIRTHNWSVTAEKNSSTPNQTIFSPRAQFAIKPDWKKEMLFRASAGVYHQPPFYRELRDASGTIVPNVKAQKSTHFVLGNEYSFKLWERPFKLVTEAYYKNLQNVNSYTVEDVRIRYAANNNTKAYAYGAEFRLNGAFVPGTESWVSIGYLKTEENISNRGYIARPTDQRLKFAVLFQDYVPTIPNLKMYLNMVYNTGVPGGSPNYADPYIFQNRLRDYKRVDLGISYIFVDAKKVYTEKHWLHFFKELNVGLEIFNLFNIQNSITNTWVIDVDSKQQFAIPNFMTTRVLNLKLGIRF